MGKPNFRINLFLRRNFVTEVFRKFVLTDGHLSIYSGDGRVKGGLNLSRAFGDHMYKDNSDIPLKDQMISAFPGKYLFDPAVFH